MSMSPQYDLELEALHAVRTILLYLGEDPLREGLLETPARFLKAMREMVGPKPSNLAELFKTFKTSHDEMIIVRDIRFISVCEHHMLSFTGIAHVGYLPSQGKVLGLSKIPRLVDYFALGFTLQEDIANNIADAMDKYLIPKGVGVVLDANHGCMQCRGVKKEECTAVTSSLRGAIKNDPATRAEFFNLIGLNTMRR